MSGRPPHEVGPHWGEVGIHGMHRFREWDAVVTVETTGPAEDEVDFIALDDGRVLPEAALTLAAAVEQGRPYRAHAVRRGDGLWAVGVRTIEVEERLEPGDAFERVEGDRVVRGRRLVRSLWEIERSRL